jgi:uncharacterized protein YciI
VLVCAILRMKDPELNLRHRPDHLAYLEDLERQGKVHARGPFGDGAGGLVIYRVADVAEARRLAEADPLVRTGARELELHPWEPVAP